MSEDLRVLEFGNQVMVSLGMDKSDPVVTDMLKQNAEQTLGALKYISDLMIIGEMEIFDFPRVDVLNRFSYVGWRAKYASNGYWELKEHFKCRDEHIPNKITMKFIWKIIVRWNKERKVKDYE